MARSPAHKFGQIIGGSLEAAIEPRLVAFAAQQGLYLDRKGPRPARPGVKATWTDRFGNKHDLDYVLERGGSPTEIGTPVAFIEIAWRRYTKHSRNKAQEIQGAILPLAETHSNVSPFMGAVLGGVFTEGAITQLESLGFVVLYLPYESIIEAWSGVGIDARYDEGTPDDDIEAKVLLWEALGENRRAYVAERLVALHREGVDGFMDGLARVVNRRIQLIRVLPLWGTQFECRSITEAIAFLRECKATAAGPVIRYEIEIRYTNGDSVRAEFAERAAAIQFLRGSNHAG